MYFAGIDRLENKKKRNVNIKICYRDQIGKLKTGVNRLF